MRLNLSVSVIRTLKCLENENVARKNRISRVFGEAIKIVFRSMKRIDI